MKKDEERIKIIESIIAKGGNFKKIAKEYTHGESYVYAKIMEIIIGYAYIYINKKKKHCIVKINGTFFDAENKPFNNEDGSFKPFLSYEINQNCDASNCDDYLCLKEWGLYSPECSANEIIWCVEKYLKEYGESEAIKKRLDLFKRMCSKYCINDKLNDIREPIKSLKIQEKSKYKITRIENILRKNIYYFKSVIFEDTKDFNDIAYLFTHGGCYIYAKIISIIIPRAKVYYNFDEGHCAVYLDGVLFDSEGIIKENINDFLPSKNIDDDYCCLDEYGLEGSSYEHIVDTVEEYLKRYKVYDSTEKKLEKFLELIN